MSTYAAPILIIPTAHTHNQGGGAVDIVFQAIRSGNGYSIDWEDVPTANGLRETVIKVNSSLYGRRWRAQPFANALIELFMGSDVDLPDGFIGHSYVLDWTFQSDPATSLYSGSLPPGLTFTQVSFFEWTITGTPTTLGSYTFQLRVDVGVTVGFITFHVTILPDPDGGSAFASGF